MLYKKEKTISMKNINRTSANSVSVLRQLTVCRITIMKKTVKLLISKFTVRKKNKVTDELLKALESNIRKISAL